MRVHRHARSAFPAASRPHPPGPLSLDPRRSARMPPVILVPTFPASGQPWGSFRVAYGYACHTRPGGGLRPRLAVSPAQAARQRGAGSTTRLGPKRAPAHPCQIGDDAAPALDRMLCQTRDSPDPAPDAHAHQGKNPAHSRSIRPDAAPSAAQGSAATAALRRQAPPQSPNVHPANTVAGHKFHKPPIRLQGGDGGSRTRKALGVTSAAVSLARRATDCPSSPFFPESATIYTF